MVAQTAKNLPAMQETWFHSLSREIPWRKKWPPTPVFLPEEFHGRVTWRTIVHGVTKESDTTEQLTLYLFINILNNHLRKLKNEKKTKFKELEEKK